MQNYERMYDYIHEYQKLVHDIYSKDGIAYLVTYYNINKDETIWEDIDLLNGSYERIGELSGTKWNKILLLPVYFSEQISTSFDGEDIGYNKDNQSSITIPSSYGITPYPGDIIKLEQEYLNPNNDTYPLFIITGVEISSNTERRFWKLAIRNYQSMSTDDIEPQVENNYVFYEYDKTIHTLVNAQILAKLMNKSETLKSNTADLIDSNSGFYYL